MESFQKEKLMPCYSVNTVSLDFQAGDLGLLHKGCRGAGSGGPRPSRSP